MGEKRKLHNENEILSNFKINRFYNIHFNLTNDFSSVLETTKDHICQHNSFEKSDLFKMTKMK